MEKPLFIYYAKCGTCQKAMKWLKAQGIDVQSRDILTDTPTQEELKQWVSQSNLPEKKFFNTSGLRYKELNLKSVLPTATPDEMIALLASEGKLVKRPVLVYNNHVLVGFKESDYATLFEK